VRLLIIAFLIVHPLALQTAAPLGAQASLPADFRQGPTDSSKQAVTPAIPGNFQRPWDDPKTALVIDPYYANPIDWDKLKTEPRVVAIIHKATIGASKIDPAYFTRKEEARKRGYLWGSYHWGVSGNPEEQADYYLDTVKPGDDELIALDLEDVASKKLMNAEESLRFIKRVKERTGRYPLLYTNHKSAKLLSAKFKGTEFAEAPLWYARFESAVTDFPSGLWRSYTLWQFSSEIRSQMTLPGVKPDMDVNVYNGTADDLKSNWPLTRSMRLNGS
jgi:lysozyme